MGRNFWTASAVRPGHVAKKFLSMAWVQVEMTGLKHVWCRKLISSVFFWAYAECAKLSCEDGTGVEGDLLSSMFQRPVV